jgi:CheY-like chemotaxis protein/EAL domain-containing protein (putative c-di-GMP-specific phosphodiesterase class I)
MPPNPSSAQRLASTLIRDCGNLAALNWSPDLVSRILNSLQRLAAYANSLGKDVVQEASLDLYAYFSGLEKTLDAGQDAEFRRLIERLQVAMLNYLPEADEALRYVDLLTTDGAIPADLADQFEARDFILRIFKDTEALAEAVRRKPSVALLVEPGQVTAACATLDTLAKNIPASDSTIIVCVGRCEPGARVQALLGGAELFIEQFDDPSLTTRVIELIDRPHEEAYRVLLVDDDTGTRLYLRRVLEQAGMAVQECSDPHDVLKQIRAFKPDLLLVDLYMPGIDGMSLTMSLRQQPELTVLPIVFLSGEHSDEARFQAIQAGGDDFLTKPVRPRILIAAVRSRIKRARSLNRQLPVGAGIALRGGRLRRGDFLAQLGEALRSPLGPWHVLISVKLDQADALGKQLGLAGAYEIEQSVATRFATVLAEDDAYTLWLEFGFGILASRGSREEIVELAQGLCRSMLERPFLVQHQEMQLTLSVGIALPPEGPAAGDADRWFASAYAAQAIAHRLGGNRFEGVLTREHGSVPPERVLIIREWVKEAVQGQNILIEFQPMLPLRGDHIGQYALVTKLRDFRAPLAGATRAEYLHPAREAGALPLIERVALFSAFEAIEEQRARDRNTRVLVPMDLASFDHAQFTWLEAELHRRKAHAAGLIIEVDAGLLLERPVLIAVVKRLKEMGIAISLSDSSGSLTRIDQLQSMKIDMLRLPFSAIDGVPVKTFSDMIAPWRASGCTLIVDQIEDVGAVSQLWALGIGYLQGDTLAASGPRLDYDFQQGGT